MKRGILLALLIVNSVLLPFGCISLLEVFNALNPMQRAFVTSIHVTNATDEPLRVTPIGASGRQAVRSSLPIYVSASPAWRSNQRGGFAVAPGDTITLQYDWDDINLAEIVVQRTDGSIAQLVADPAPQQNRYRQPNPNRFTISDFSALHPVPPDIRTGFDAAQRSFSMEPWLVLFLLPWITFTILFILHRRARSTEQTKAHAARGNLHGTLPPVIDRSLQTPPRPSRAGGNPEDCK